eukprot:scaffold232691_cov14-Prasinocladus_malaysianus.AAC.1
MVSVPVPSAQKVSVVVQCRDIARTSIQSLYLVLVWYSSRDRHLPSTLYNKRPKQLLVPVRVLVASRPSDYQPGQGREA